jgi:hypothetical protein
MKQSASQCGERLEYEMRFRIQDLSLHASLRRIANYLAQRQSIFAVWTIIATLLIQQSAIARISAPPVNLGHISSAVLTEAGSVFIDSESETKIARVTDSRDGQAVLAQRINSSSFNLDSSRLVVSLDGVPTLYAFDPFSFSARKQGPLFGSTELQADSCDWSAVESETMFGLESTDSARIYAYNTRLGGYTLLRDFSDVLGNGKAKLLSKSWSDDNHFAFGFEDPASNQTLVVVWDRAADSTFTFYINDRVDGVSGFKEAHLDRSGEALIVNGDVTRVWRYRSHPQSEAVQLESTGDLSESMTATQQSNSFDLFASSSRLADLPRSDVSRDGRLSIFSSQTSGSHSDVFISSVAATSTPLSVTWTNLVNCTADGNLVQKTGGVDQMDDAHATSAQAVLSGDAYVEFTAEQANKERWCGLNNSNSIHQSAADINFAIRLTETGKANVVENGVVKAKLKYKANNVFRVAAESGVINYYKNGSVFYTSTAKPAYPLLVDASLVNSMAAVNKVMMYVTVLGSVISISPARMNLVGGGTAQFAALITGATADTITWSATGGSLNSTGSYTAPSAAGVYTVKAACTSNPGISAAATVSVTGGPDVTAPVISGVNASNITTTGVTLSWNTDEPSDTQVEYGTSVGYGSLSTQNPALVTSHGVAFGGLTSAMQYHYRVRSKDAAGNQAVSGDFTFTTQTAADTTPPMISGVSASNVTSGTASISWSTNEASDTQVEFGTTSAYGSATALNTSMVSSHAASLSGLSAGTPCHYRVKSKDAAGNLSISGDFTFTTLNAADTTAPIITGVSASSVTSNSATIAWTTNESSDTQAEYGTTTGYGSSSTLDAAMVTGHSAFVSGLSANMTCHYRVKSKDVAGNLAVSGDFAFTTSAAAPPASSGVITNHNVYPEPAPPALPRAGGTFVDPTFGTTIMRVTDETDGASNYNYYSYWPTFNLNSTWFFIACDSNPMLYKFDSNNFKIISKGPLFDQVLPGGGFMSTEDAEWSGSNPTLLYGYYGLKLWSFDVSSRVYTLIKDFTGQLPPGSLGQMSRSLDDNMFAFTVKDSNYAPTGYMVWQRNPDKMLRNVSLSNFDEVEMDKSGRYLSVKAQFGGGVDFQAVDLQTGTAQGLTDPGPDFSPGHSDNGRQIVVGYDDWNNQYTIRNYATPHQFKTVIAFGSDWSQSNHLSMLGDDESWCVISNYTSGAAPVGPFRQEIFQTSTDGSQSVRRLAHHHSVYRDYWDTPRADISRDGRFVAFTSNWGSTTRRDVFIIKVPQGSATGDTTPPTVSGVSASGLTSTGAAINWTTNEASDSQVEFGTSSTYGSATSLNASMVSSHNAIVSGLSANTLYHYRVRSRDAAGNLSVSADFTFTTANATSGSSAQNVVWTSAVNCTVSGNSLQKTAGRDDTCDAGAISQQKIVSGDGYLEFTAGAAGKIRFCGLTHIASVTDFFAIDFGIKLTELGVAEIRENNSYQGETTYTGSDVFRIALAGGVVKYSKNGVVFYTSGKAPAYPLVADATLLNLAGTVNNAVISGFAGAAMALSLSDGQSIYIADSSQPDGRLEILLGNIDREPVGEIRRTRLAGI